MHWKGGGDMADKEKPRPGSLDWLADCILADRARAAEKSDGRRPPWYMLNVNHPAVLAMLDQYRQAHGLRHALSDRERTVWEIKMLHPKARAALMAYYTRQEAIRAEVRRRLAAGTGEEARGDGESLQGLPEADIILP